MRKIFIEVVYRHSPVEMMLWGAMAIGVWTLFALFCSNHEKRWKAWIWLNRASLAVCILCIIKYTLLREGGNRSIRLTPFYSFSYSIHSDRYNTLTANLLLFLPIGMCMPYLLMAVKNNWVRKHPASTTIVTAAVFSFFIEVMQFAFGLGLCETDDLIFNTLGASMGTLSLVVFWYILNST